ncbi:hypothetical protein I546_2200 [Mycobacterium kansasii 732]|nr:hypothetical protein I546_2200 [Mycobacterium kansasii 732]
MPYHALILGSAVGATGDRFRCLGGLKLLPSLPSRIHGGSALSVCRRCGNRRGRSCGFAKPLVARARNQLTAWAGKAVVVAGRRDRQLCSSGSKRYPATKTG